MQKIKYLINYLIKNPWILFLLLSIHSISSYGIDLWLHMVYNLIPTHLLTTDESLLSGFYSFKSNPMNFMYYYGLWIAPWLEYGILIILMSLIVKFFAFILIYKIAFFLVKNKDLSIFISLLFLMSPGYATHGVVMNGLFGIPLFFDASLSTLATFAGILFLLKNRFIIAGLFFGLSIQLHALYGLNAIVWISFGLIMVLKKRDSLVQWKSFILGLIPIVGSIVFIALFSLNSESKASVSIAEWYRYIYSIDPGDVSMFWTLENSGYALLPLWSLASYFAWLCKKKDIAEYMMLGSSTFFLLVMIFEVLHLNNIFFGFISEYFLISEFRRGAWIPSLLALILITKNFSKIEPIFKKRFPMIVSMGIITYLAPSVTTVSIFFLLIGYLSKNIFYVILSFIPLIMLIPHVEGNHFTIATQIKSIILLLSSMSLSLLVFWKWKKITTQNMVIGVCGFVLLTYLTVNIASGKFMTSVSTLMSEGMMSKTDKAMVISVIGRVQQYDQKVASFLKNKDQDKSRIIKMQLPPSSFTYQDEIFYGKSLHFSRGDIGWPVFSKLAYVETIEKISSLIGQSKLKQFLSKEGFYSKSILLDFIEKEYNSLSHDHLIKAWKESKLKYYLIKNERNDLKNALVYRGDIFYVYDLTLIKRPI